MATRSGDPRLLHPLGEGASSEVWLAESEPGRVALKIARSEEHAMRLADEAHRLLLADSPHLAAVLDAGRFARSVSTPDGRSFAAGTAYVALEWVAGEPIAPEQVAAAERVNLAFTVARDVGQALADLHAGGTAHGDVKPANVVVTGSGSRRRATLVDLGLAGDVTETVPRGGTLRYLAPEALSRPGASDGGGRDLWALGVTLLEIASGGAVDPGRVEAAARGLADVDLRDLVTALLAPHPAARARAAWAARRGEARAPEPEATQREERRRVAAVRRSYLAVRRNELASAAHAARVSIEVEEPAGGWLRAAVDLERRVARLRGDRRSDTVVLPELGAFGRSRWLVRLVGPTAAVWSPLGGSDGELAQQLTALAAHGPLETITRRALERGSRAAETVDDEPIALALAIAGGRASPATLDRAEARLLAGDCPPTLGIALGRALRLRGEVARSLAVLARIGTPLASVHAAETARRARDPAACRGWLERVVGVDEPRVAERRAATAARLQLDSGDAAGALALLEPVPESAVTLEVKALVVASLGDRDRALRLAEQGEALASDPEERARLAGVRATLEHGSGALAASLAAFRQAAALAAEAGAVLEEATYLTGVAAAAGRFGHLGEALEAARRSALLFEHLGRPAEAARAVLTRAAVLSQLGAREETVEAAQDAIARARSSGDRECQAYAHLALADVLGDADRLGIEHAQRAAGLLEGATEEAWLRAGARVLRRGGAVDIERGDTVARRAQTALDARLDWWGARAAVQLGARDATDAAVLLTELTTLTVGVDMPAVCGPALADGAALAAFLGDGDAARGLAQAAAECARELLPRVPAELRARLAARPWVSRTLSEPSPLAAAQIANLETLVRALGGREHLRPLLDQALDALVLWTGVERGLLLLRAPGGRLVPRAARNLRRDDLVGVQRELSHSLAERAMAEREPVVAVDATGELSTVHRSVHALKLRSVLAVPLVSRGEVLGVVYLDDRVRRGAFGPRELAWVRLVATLAAVAIGDARDQLLLRRAARRAERAEQRVAEELARREAALDAAERTLAHERGARDTRFAYAEFIGASAPLRAMLRVVDRVTQSNVPVLVIGESGTGKELVARAIHGNSSRGRQPFVTENCSAIPEPLLESALFGHVRGAFTGADRPRAGLFDAANGGTLFLDEVGEMSLAMQAKLLRVLETGEIRPVGTDRTRRVDVRVIAATHRDLARMVEEGRFREDLLYRIDVISIRVPALRERPGDVDLLVRHFIERYAPGRHVRVLPEALGTLRRYAWPGNVRQLENEVRRALVLCDDVIGLDHLSPTVIEALAGTSDPAHELDVRLRIDALERELVREALSRTRGNQTRAAELLGLSRFGLQKMMRRLGISTETASELEKASLP